ncbi:MAG: LysM peptidoglycan-binding domain-containing protein [Cohnella sp.]|nr:LysM peptidoglycan-binding domain-containing protein [Cohnella sp.]
MTASSQPRYASRSATQAAARSHRGWKAARSLFILIAFLILFSGFAFAHTFASSEEGTPAGVGEIVIYVDSGDTLWELAAEYKKDHMDTRDAVHLLKKRNGLSSSSLHSGQELILPAKMLP